MRFSHFLIAGSFAGLSVAFPAPNAGFVATAPLEDRSLLKRIAEDGVLSLVKRQTSCQVSGSGSASAYSSSGGGCNQQGPGSQGSGQPATNGQPAANVQPAGNGQPAANPFSADESNPFPAGFPFNDPPGFPAGFPFENGFPK